MHLFAQTVYTNVKYTHVVLIYGETERNNLAAKNMYQARFPNRNHPWTAMIVESASKHGRKFYEHEIKIRPTRINLLIVYFYMKLQIKNIFILIHFKD